MRVSKPRQSGFTLVEIATVLVIIGVLLAGVLKGQAMIDNARIKGLVNDLDGVSSAYNSYFDRYQALPGTEALATATARGWLNTAAGTGTGILVITPATTFAPAAVQQSLWQSLISAGFFVGTPIQTTNPVSATGGLIGVSVAPYALVGTGVCLSGLSTRQAAGVDAIVDGSASTNAVGAFQGATGAANPLAPATTAPTATAYNETTITNWSMCRTI